MTEKEMLRVLLRNQIFIMEGLSILLKDSDAIASGFFANQLKTRVTDTKARLLEP